MWYATPGVSEIPQQTTSFMGKMKIEGGAFSNNPRRAAVGGMYNLSHTHSKLLLYILVSVLCSMWPVERNKAHVFFSDKHLLGQDRFGPTNGIHIQAATVLE